MNREEIREGLQELLLIISNKDGFPLHIQLNDSSASVILSYLDSVGVVIKVETALPSYIKGEIGEPTYYERLVE